MTDTFDRTQLDGKDRGQLSEIAAALGVKSVSRMRKAELVDAIVSAAKGSAGAGGTNGSEPARPRKIRSTASGGDDLAALAAEEDSLVSSDTPADDMVVRRPSTASTATKPAARATAPGARATPTTRPAIHTTTPGTTRPTTAARARSRGATTTARAIAGAGAGGAEIATVPTAVSNASRARSSPASC